MNKYYHDIDDEKYDEFRVFKWTDNRNVAKRLTQLSENEDDVGFNTALLHLGMLLQIIAAALNIKKPEIDKLMEPESRSRQRKMEIIVKELNEKINLRYEFDEDVEILIALFTYKDKGYLLLDKSAFIDLILEKSNDIDSLDKI